jgi:molybdopterin adenylyltransferase
MRAEGIRKTPFAALSRGVCGARGETLILNLPGSPAGAVESLEAVIGLIPHALNLLRGETEHPAAKLL